MALKSKALNQVRAGVPLSAVSGETFKEPRVVHRLKVSEIEPDPDQPREYFDEEALIGLSETMESEGQQSPIEVRYVNGKYRITYGERRWRAANILKWDEMDAFITEISDKGQILVRQLIENLHSKDMTEYETAKGFQALLDLGVCKTGRDIAKKTGFSEAAVSIFLGVLNKAPKELVKLVETGVATMDVARIVGSIAKSSPDKAEKIIEEAKQTGKLPLRDDLRAIDADLKDKPINKPKAKKEPENQASSENTGSVATALDKPSTTPSNTVITNSSESNAELKKENVASTPLPANKIVIYVALKDSSKDFWVFGARVNNEGTAVIATDIVHADIAMAWVRFGNEKDSIGEFCCSDLVVQGIVAV